MSTNPFPLPLSHPLRSFKSHDFKSQKQTLLSQLLYQKNRYKCHHSTLIALKTQSLKLQDDFQRYTLKIQKAKKRREEIRGNLGSTEAFFQQNHYFNQLAEQMIIQKSVGEGEGVGEVNPDVMSYEELLDLGEKIGKVSRGLSRGEMEGLRRKVWRGGKEEEGKCMVCCEEYEEKEIVVELRCGHCYHEECIGGWLKEENVCPLCKKCVLEERRERGKEEEKSGQKQREREKREGDI